MINARTKQKHATSLAAMSQDVFNRFGRYQVKLMLHFCGVELAAFLCNLRQVRFDRSSLA
jgi:hypothetical protein